MNLWKILGTKSKRITKKKILSNDKYRFFGDGPWADNTLKKISKNNNFSISFIVSRFKKPDSKLEKWSKKLSVDLISYEDVNFKL